MVIQINNRHNGASKLVETDNDELIDKLSECASYSCAKQVLKNFKKRFKEVEDKEPNMILDVCAQENFHDTKPNKTYGNHRQKEIY